MTDQDRERQLERLQMASQGRLIAKLQAQLTAEREKHDEKAYNDTYAALEDARRALVAERQARERLEQALERVPRYECGYDNYLQAPNGRWVRWTNVWALLRGAGEQP